jgi:serine/threonine-protein kinase
MNRDHIQRIEAIFDRVQEAAAERRASLLDELCSGDAAVRDEVEALLDVQEAAVDYFESFLATVGKSAGAELDAAAARGRTIGRWRLLELVGRGGMAAVYRVERTAGDFEQTAALKLLRHGLDGGPAAARFAAERRILAQLQHPHIASVIDGGITSDGLPYLVMEYVDGVPITDYCDRQLLSVRQRLELFRSVIEAVQYAHRNLVVHRDLKPSNILVDGDGRVKLLDFGIAKLLADKASGDVTVTEARMLTPVYAAPEQITGGRITTATDVYGLGVLLYELLAGRRPYEVEGLSAGESERLITDTVPPAPSQAIDGVKATARRVRPERLRRQLAGDIDNICMMALRKEPARRYDSAGQLGDDVDRYLRGMPVSARRDTFGYRAAKFVGRNRAGVAVATVAALLLIGFAVVMALVSAQLASERELSDRVTELFVDVFATADPSRGATITAREVLDRGAERVQVELDGQPEVQAELLDVMGRVYRNLGLYERAVDLLATSARLREQTGGETVRLAASLDALGEAQRLKGDYAVAEELLRRAVELNVTLEGPNNLQTARTMTALGRVLLARGSYEEAESTLRRSLDIHRAAPGRQPEVLADTLDALAGLALAQGGFDESRAMFEESLAIRRELFAEDNAVVAASLNNLATALGRSGDQAGAEALQREALQIYTVVFGEEHPNVATAANNLALTLFLGGRSDEAEPLFRESLAMRRRLLDANHADIAQSASNLGLLLQTVGRHQEAAAFYQEALEIRRAAFGDGHLRVAQTLNNLGLLEQTMGDYDAAEVSLREGLATLRGLFGDGHPLVATNLSNLASVLYDQGDLEESERLYRESLAVRRAALPEGHLDTSYSLLGLARLLAASNNPARAAEAEPLATEGLQIRRASLPAGHALIVEAEEVVAAARGPGVNR